MLVSLYGVDPPVQGSDSKALMNHKSSKDPRLHVDADDEDDGVELPGCSEEQ